jgi:hypothetical protein
MCLCGTASARFDRHLPHDRCPRKQQQIRTAIAMSAKVNAVGAGRFRERKVTRRTPATAMPDSDRAVAKT